MPRSDSFYGPGRPRRPAFVVVAVLSLVYGLGCGGGWSTAALAQRTRGAVHVGIQVGQPGGLTAKSYRSPKTAYTGLLTTDGDDFVDVYVYRVHERPLPNSPLHLHLGAGALAGAQGLDQRRPLLTLGLTTQIGLNFFADNFEVFLQMAPTLRTLPEIRPQLGGSVGLRYFLRRP